eukprot:2282592-Pleurochrysis_carterae.AAC.5
MFSTQATACMHNRLHAGATRLHLLPSFVADAHASLAQGRFDGCSACTEASATWQTHDSVLYKPSYAGRLNPADIALPFVRTLHTGVQYLLNFLVLVDNHLRFKSVHF